MKITYSRAARIVLLATLLCLGSANSWALSYVMMSDRDLLDSSPLLVRAQVIEVLPARGGPAGIESVYSLQIQEQFKGAQLPVVVQLTLPGGLLNSGFGQVNFGIPKLQPGQTLLLFAEQRSDGSLQAMQLTMGMFFRLQQHGVDYYERALSAEGDRGEGFNATYHRPRAAEPFDRWLRAAKYGKAAATEDYFIDLKAVSSWQKFNLLRGDNNNAVRWFQFDTDTALNWVSTAGGQAGMVQNEFAMITAAANALTNDAGSRLTVTHSGATIPSPDTHCDNGNSDGHAVLWNDPLNAISGSYNCANGGVLASAGPCFFETSTISNGQPYNEAFEGRIQIQDNAGCYFDGDSGRNGAEVMAHEMGHVIGLAHSCGDAETGSCAGAPAAAQVATMRASAFGDGRGASFMPDDQAALAFVYPSGLSPNIFANGFE